jgi:AraC-like DNA-binding protein
VFVEAIRRYISTLPDDQHSWLAGVRDPIVGRALALLHASPAQPWTMDDLAREAATSRSVLGERFTAMVAEPPMQYLTRWRLALAAKSLGNEREQVARIAKRVGYDSEAAFNRAFKREFGMPPAAWRRAARA